VVVALTGTGSLKFSSETGDSAYSASQVVELYQKIPTKVVVGVASKAEAVVNSHYASPNYALILDVTLMDGTIHYDTHVAVFNEGTHNWQTKTVSVDLPEPIKTITIHLFFKKCQGTVYFDDVTLQEEQHS